MPRYEVNLDQIEHNCDALFEAHVELSDHCKLNGIERTLVLARLAYIHEQTVKRCLSGADLEAYERARAVMIERAEQTRAENVAADETKVNAEGGSA